MGTMCIPTARFGEAFTHTFTRPINEVVATTDDGQRRFYFLGALPAIGLLVDMVDRFSVEASEAVY